jgi:hypothetical protein
VTERPQNLRTARSTERTHNSHRHAAAHADAGQPAGLSYHGSHRAERMHRAEDSCTAAHQRMSRVGRHHADRYQHHTDRW